MRIAISGATGFVGARLTKFYLEQGHQVCALTRQSSFQYPKISSVLWEPSLDYIQGEKLEGLDAVIHLAGATISERWSPEYKKTILDSRLQSTRLLCQSLVKLSSKPKVLIAASAIGFYGNQEPEKVLDEHNPGGQGFLADVCQQWEAETKTVQDIGIRVVQARLGVVLDKKGGALAKMLPVFRWGLGGALGNGRQMISWVALEEVPYVIDHLIKNPINGPVNVVSPQPVSNGRFTRVLAQVLQRPAMLPVPPFAVRLLFGEMGQILLLEGVRVVPHVLNESGYRFRFPDLQSALEEALR